jgi:uncharacterized protein (TIGR02117 family)
MRKKVRKRKLRLVKKIGRWTAIALFSALLLLAIGYVTPRKWVYVPKTGCNFQVCVSNVGIHTNIIVPIREEIFDWNQHLGLRELTSSGAEGYKYLSFGWGDRLFYMATPTPEDFKLSNALDALTTPGPSVMYVEKLIDIPQNFEVKCVKVDRGDYLNLMAYIKSAFQMDKQQRAIIAGDGYNLDANFYEAIGSYSVLKSCNAWTAAALRTADLNTPLWDGLSSAILLHLKGSCN